MMRERRSELPATGHNAPPASGRGGEGPILCLLLGDDPNTAARLKRRAAETGRAIVFAAAGYDLCGGDAIDGAPVRAPMDYLTPADIDALYRDLYAWQAGLPSQPMGDGRSLDAASSPPGHAPSTISWLLRFGAHLHLRLRFVRLVAAMIAAERPSVICPVGRSETQPWAAALLGAIVAQADPKIVIAPPERLLSAQDAWGVALERERRAEAREQAIRAQGREAMRRLLKERETRLQRLLERAGGPEAQSLDALIAALATQQPPAAARLQRATDASDVITYRLRRALAAAQSRLATLTAAHRDQKLGARRQQKKLLARLEAAQARAGALEALTQRQAVRLAAAKVRAGALEALTQRQAVRLKTAQGRIASDAGARRARRARLRAAQAHREKRARRDAVRPATRSVWSLLRHWFRRKGPRR